MLLIIVIRNTLDDFFSVLISIRIMTPSMDKLIDIFGHS